MALFKANLIKQEFYSGLKNLVDDYGPKTNNDGKIQNADESLSQKKNAER